MRKIGIIILCALLTLLCACGETSSGQQSQEDVNADALESDVTLPDTGTDASEAEAPDTSEPSGEAEGQDTADVQPAEPSAPSDGTGESSEGTTPSGAEGTESGGGSAPAAKPESDTPTTTAPSVTPDIPPASSAEDSQEVTSPATEPDEPAGQDPADAKAIAESYIGKSVASLYGAIGEPLSSDYAPSCLGSGEDGNLYYDGFVVYTYRENGSETISYVE